MALSEAEQSTEYVKLIQKELRDLGLSEDEQNVQAVADAIDEQFEAVAATGSVDLEAMYVDLFCIFET